MKQLVKRRNRLPSRFERRATGLSPPKASMLSKYSFRRLSGNERDCSPDSSSEGSCGLAEQRDGRSHPRVYIHVGNAARPEKFSRLGGLLLWPRTLKMPKVGGAGESRSIFAPRFGLAWGWVAPNFNSDARVSSGPVGSAPKRVRIPDPHANAIGL